ncbi:MAG TPA: metallopeptidase TldD-related protein [Acidimicrobiales bacterium]|nr:metallopeptidase TldD-related protein [Acidimicrobiales bacterium]
MADVDDAAGTSAAEVAAEACERTLRLVGRGPDALVSAVVGASSLTRFANSRIHQNVTEDVRAVSLTLAVGGRVAKASTSRTDPADLAALVERARAAAALRPVDPDYAGFAPPAPVPPVAHWDDATAGATPDQRAAVVAAFVAAGAGLEAAGYCSTAGLHHALASTTGQRATARTSLAVLDGIHRAAVGRDHPADGYAQVSSVRLADLDGRACGARAAAKAAAGLDPVSLPPGPYEVVLEPKAVAAMLLYPAYLGFNGKAHAEGTSFVHLGEAQWDTGLDLWDDALDPRVSGTAHDAEGTPKARLDLVRAGVSVGLAHDRRSARLAGVEPTGHSVGIGSFGGYPGNVFLGGGGATPEALVGGVERGLLVTDFWYNRVLDPKTQVVTGLTRNGLFLVEEGRIAGPVQNMRFTQSVVGGFGPGRVRGLGDDARLVGSEGADLFHVPTVRLAQWAFTGNAQG